MRVRMGRTSTELLISRTEIHTFLILNLKEKITIQIILVKLISAI
jgi:hypothetical protein